MGKKRCKLSQEEYAEEICNVENFVCKKCNRMAKKAKSLCDSKKSKKKD